MSTLQELKWFVVHYVGLDKDAIHIYIGVACYLLAITIGRMPDAAVRALMSGLALSLLLERQPPHRMREREWVGRDERI